METVYMQAQGHHQKMVHQYHGRGPITRYNSIDNGFLLEPPYHYTNTYLVQSRPYHQPSHRLVQVQPQPQPQPPLLPLPTTRPQQTPPLPLLRTSSGKLNRAVRKPKIHESGNLKSNRKNKEVKLPKEGREKTIQSDDQSSNDVMSVKEGCEDYRVFSDLVFALSPHPSSLPLPKFFLREKATTAKLSCKDDEATSGVDLRRRVVLRLP